MRKLLGRILSVYYRQDFLRRVCGGNIRHDHWSLVVVDCVLVVRRGAVCCDWRVRVLFELPGRLLFCNRGSLELLRLCHSGLLLDRWIDCLLELRNWILQRCHVDYGLQLMS